MSTKTENPTAWAAERGAAAAERRAEREAQAQAAAAADEARHDVPIETLTGRFAEVAARVLELVDAFATAAGVRVIADSVHPPTIELRAPTPALDRRDHILRLHHEDDAVRVTVSAHARSDQLFVDLADPAFDAASAAHRIATRFLTELELREGGSRHVVPQ